MVNASYLVLSKDCSIYKHKSVIEQLNTMRIYCVPGSILDNGDVAVTRVSTLKEFIVLRRKSDNNKNQGNNFRHWSVIIKQYKWLMDKE